MAVAIGPSWFGKSEANRDLGRVDSAAAFWSVLEDGRVDKRLRAFW